MKELRFTLTTHAGDFVLPVAPDGWSQSMITWERQEKYFGVFRSWTLPLKFVKTGALELRREFYTYGMVGTGRIKVEKLDKVNEVYNVAFYGIMDFTTFVDDEDSVEVSFTDSGFTRLLKDYGEVEYEIENSVMTALDVYAASDVQWAWNGHDYFGVELLNLGFNLLNKMSKGKLTDGSQELSIRSDYLTNYDYTDNGEKIIFIPGAQLNYDGQRFGTFKTSFVNWFKSVSSVFGLGMGIEFDQGGNEVVRIEPINHFFENAEGIDIGTVSNLSVSMNKKMLFKRVKIGYEGKDYETAGLQDEEVNASTRWEIDTEATAVEFDLISKYRGDGKGIYDTINTSTDDNNNDIFFCQLHINGSLTIDDFGRAKYVGANPNTAIVLYNSIITPRRNMTRWSSYFGNATYGLDGEDIEFLIGDNLIKLYETAEDGITFTPEASPVELDQRNRFFPILFEVEKDMPADFIQQLNENATKIITFAYKGETYGGYVMKVEAELTGKSSHKITLMASNNYQNALNQLINRRNG